MNTNQTPVAVAMNVAGSKATPVRKADKRAGKAHPTESQMVAYCVAAFGDYLTADATLQNAKALWDAARMGLRTELARAHKVIGAGKKWDAFKAQVRAALVNAKVCGTPAGAGRVINNALIALSLTGNGAKKGGKRKGAGRKEGKGEPVTTVLSDKDVIARNLKAVAFIAEQQRAFADDADVLEMLGELLAILAAPK